MSALSLVFAPHLPWWLLGLLAAVAVALAGLSFWRRARGAAWRALFQLAHAPHFWEKTEHTARRRRNDAAALGVAVPTE